MLLPFDWAVLTVDDALLIVNFIETSTATPTISKNLKKIEEKRMLPLYDRLVRFVEQHDHYNSELAGFSHKE